MGGKEKKKKEREKKHTFYWNKQWWCFIHQDWQYDWCRILQVKSTRHWS